jgi:hypothetical protein
MHLMLVHRPFVVSSEDAIVQDRPALQILSPEERAERELAAYFGRPRDAAALSEDNAEVASLLQSISAYHRGVLGLYHDARTWPAPVKKQFGNYTALAIRLYCADHPAVGSTPTLERLAAEQLAATLEAEGNLAPSLFDLHCRAVDHHCDALGA